MLVGMFNSVDITPLYKSSWLEENLEKSNICLLNTFIGTLPREKKTHNGILNQDGQLNFEVLLHFL